jgi:hypothetical protein
MGSCLALLVVLALPGPQDGAKAKVPDAAAVREATKTIRDIYKDEYAKKTPADKVALARKLLEQSAQNRDNPAIQYTSLVEAKDLAVSAGDLKAAADVLQSLGSAFDVDVVELKAAAFASLAKNLKTPEDMTEMARAYARLGEEASAADEYDGSVKAYEAAAGIARRAKDLTVASRADVKAKEAAQMKGRYDKVKKARETLSTNPEDRAANLVVGQHLCMVKGAWESGLPLLAKGEGPIGALAAKDVSDPGDTAEQIAVGDGWWDLAEKETGRSREFLRARAKIWYEKAMGKAAGLPKAKLEQRLSVLRVEALNSGDWLDITDASLFGQKGKSGDAVSIQAPVGAGNKVKMSGFPKGDYDGLHCRIQTGPQKTVIAFIIFEGNDLCFIVNPGTEKVGAARRADPTNWKFDFEVTPKKIDDVDVTILLSEGSYVIYLEGQEVGRTAAAKNGITSLTLESDQGATKFDQLRLRRRN